MSASGARVAAAQGLRIGIVAGEHSGDQLGAALIAALRGARARLELFRSRGTEDDRRRLRGLVGGRRELAVMGLTEVLRHLPRLLRLRAALLRRLRAARPHIFIGIDAPEFQSAARAHAPGRGPAHRAVRQSPGVGVAAGAGAHHWRRCDLVLCLLPFEAKFYAQHGVPAVFVGHPLADQIPLAVDREAARRALDIRGDGPLVALLPGSRLAEVTRLAAPFAAAAAYIGSRRPRLSLHRAHGVPRGT